MNYRNDPKFSDRYAWANRADPDQTAPRGAVCSGSTLFAIPSASFGLIMVEPHNSNFRVITNFLSVRIVRKFKGRYYFFDKCDVGGPAKTDFIY